MELSFPRPSDELSEGGRRERESNDDLPNGLDVIGEKTPAKILFNNSQSGRYFSPRL